MRSALLSVFLVLAIAVYVGSAQTLKTSPPPSGATQGYTLTIQVDGVNQLGGNIGVLVFQNNTGWPEDRSIAFKDIVEPAHPGTVTVRIPNLPAGDYAVALVHDVNKNHKVDKNWFGKPTEQWGMTNNPHATLKAPSFDKAKFTLNHDSEIHIQLQ